MKLRWLKFEIGTVVENVKMPGLFFDKDVPETRKWIRSPKLQFSIDGETWQDVEDGPTVPFTDWSKFYG